MLERIDLGGCKYRQLYGEALKLIPAYSESWTNMNLSDPGVTVLQSLALLSEKLDKAAETVTDGETAKLLELLGVHETFAQPARLTLFLLLRERRILPPGTPFILRDLHFETEEETAVPAGAITGIWYEQGGERRDVSNLIYAKSRLTLFEENEAGPASIHIIFSDGTKSGETMRVYVEADARFPRNKAEGEGLHFADILWEIWSGSGFVPCEIRDNTSCFTQSGFIEIKIPEDMAVRDGGYHLRATVLRHEYDLAPTITRIWGGHVELAQKRTLSRCVSFDSESVESLTLPLPFWGVETADLLVIGRDENGRFRRYGADQNEPRSYSLSNGGGAYCVHICCEKMPRAGRDSVRVLMRRPEAIPLLELGSVAGHDNQSFKPDWGDEYPVEGAKLMLRQAYGGEAVYEDVDVPGCNVYCHIAPNGEVTARRAATDGDNMLFFSQLELTCGEGGNLRRESLGECSSDGWGGKNPGGIAQSLARLTEELEAPFVAVTASDYERLALETPGLSLEAASARKTGNGVVQVAVKPYSGKSRPELGALQSGAIAKRLEERRLLNTKIEVVSPRWIPVEIEIEVSVYPQAVDPESEIARAIEKGVKWGEFDAPVSYGRIHALLDALDCVESVSRLKIRAEGTAGDNIGQDFTAVFYLENLRINCETLL